MVATHALPPPTATSVSIGAEAFAESAWKTHLRDDAAPPAWIEHIWWIQSPARIRQYPFPVVETGCSV
jgi:hypothetical protein